MGLKINSEQKNTNLFSLGKSSSKVGANLD